MSDTDELPDHWQAKEVEPPIEIDNEFALRMPKVPDFCDEGLEILIKRFGPDPLYVWKEKNVLLDGHRRKAICDRLGIAYEVRRVSCANKAEALKLMDELQLFRRNLSDHDQAILTKRHFDALRESGMKSDKAADVLATEEKVTKRTIYRRINYGEKFLELSDEWQVEIVARKMSKAIVEQITSCTPLNRKILLEGLKTKGELWLSEWCRDRVSRSKELDAKKSVASKRLLDSRSPMADAKAMSAGLYDETVVSNVTGRVRKRIAKEARLSTTGVKIDELLFQAEKAAGASARAAYRLFSDEGISDPVCVIKRKLDRAHAMISEALGEVRTKYVK